MRWLADLSDPGKNPEMLAALLAYQFKRQSEGEALTMVPGLARGLAEEASKQRNARVWLMNFLSVGEFLARETRAPAEEKGGLR
jgi:CRISPR-associated protein Cmr2